MFAIFIFGIALFNVIESGYLEREVEQKCVMIISESIPNNLTYESKAPFITPIWKVWKMLIENSKNHLRIASFYWTMLNEDVDNKTHFPSSQKGYEIFQKLVEKSKIIPLEIVQDAKQKSYHDLNLLKQNNLVKIHYINVSRLHGKGVQHAKLWISDKSSAFLGSANMDWRSLSEIKELGVLISDCGDLVQDIDKFWQALRFLSGPTAEIPKKWPSYLSPKYNHTNPLIANVNGVNSKIYIATSPPDFNPPYRTDDLTAILQTIDNAKTFISISVMDFFPLKVSYDGPSKYWPDIENHLKVAAIDRGVAVKLLISWWKHSNQTMYTLLRSLEFLTKTYNISVKFFIVPAFEKYQQDIPFSRVSHSKYMVTDNSAYIGTSNWSGDYFEDTGGISVVTEEISTSSRTYSIRFQLMEIFNTDWNSIYAHDIC